MVMNDLMFDLPEMDPGSSFTVTEEIVKEEFEKQEKEAA
jgi:hypothetical protein